MAQTPQTRAIPNGRHQMAQAFRQQTQHYSSTTPPVRVKQNPHPGARTHHPRTSVRGGGR
jgi:hypothetical protein